MNPLKIGITGIRGIAGESFSPGLIIDLASAFATHAGPGKIYICEDARPSGLMARSAVLSALLAAGCRPVDLGICPAPIMCMAVANSDAVGGVVVSAGHNPEDWNALRFVNSGGLYYNSLEAEELLDIYHQGEYEKAQWDEMEPVSRDPGARKKHLEKILSSVNAKKIRSKKYRVATDTCNGACCGPAADLLRALGCEIVALNNDPGQPFPHAPEPSRTNMRQLGSVATATKSDIGFFFDTAGERLGVVTADGEALSEEITFLMCAKKTLERKKGGRVATNVSTSRAVDDIAKKYGATVERTAVGQAHVLEAAARNGADIAGEGSGGVALPFIHLAFDSIATVAFILDAMAGENKTIAEIAGALPRYQIVKREIEREPSVLYKMLRRARESAIKNPMGAKLHLEDGIRMDWPEGWLHIRVSATKSMIRIISEARTVQKAEELAELGERIVAL